MTFIFGSLAIGLQVEWTKAKCRVDRWEEEVVLLDEEMRRVLVYCAWKADWWKETGQRARTVESPVLHEGIQAYAAQQAHQEYSMAENFASKWEVVRENARSLIERIQGSSGPSTAPMLTPGTLNSVYIDPDFDQDDPDHEAMLSDFEE